jgi:hypothetical protein
MEAIFGLTFISFIGLFYCLIFLFSIAVLVISIWLFIACIIDLSRKTEAEFPEKTFWLVILILTFVLGFGLITSLIYYFLYKPNLRFWN